MYDSMKVPLSPEGCAELIELAGSPTLALSLEQLLAQQAIEPSTQIYNALIRVYGSHTHHDRVDQLLAQMFESNIATDRNTILAAVSTAPSLPVGLERLRAIQAALPPHMKDGIDSLAVLQVSGVF